MDTGRIKTERDGTFRDVIIKAGVTGGRKQRVLKGILKGEWMRHGNRNKRSKNPALLRS